VGALLSLKNTTDDFEIEYDILTTVDLSNPLDDRQITINQGLHSVDAQIEANQKKIDEINAQIDKLTNHSDGIDYMMAVGSGLIAAAIDSLWVGEFSFERGKAWSNEKVNDFVLKAAQKQGYTGERLKGAISYLEDHFKIPSDDIWNGEGVSISAKSHHLDDLAHHPTPLGLFCSILTQFTKTGYFQNGHGEFIKIAVTDEGIIGEDLPHKIFAGTINWFFHLVSDMSGSRKTAGVGMGIPGPIVSLLKEISLLPGLNETSLPKKLYEAYVKKKFNLRSELAVGYELGRQAIPVILNEVLARSFYFIRRIGMEYKENGGFDKIEWKNTLPFKNRTIVRMMTISTGTFTVVDLADAAIRSAIKSGGVNPTFLSNFILRVNFVGVGRFAIACGTDVKMGTNKKN